MNPARRDRDVLDAIWAEAGGAGDHGVTFVGEGSLPSAFAVSDLAAGAMGAAGAAIAELIVVATGRRRAVTVDRRLASFWYSTTVRPKGWALPPGWDAVGGNYATEDGWIRLHTNAPHHRAAALATLGAEPDRESVARAVRSWRGEALETAIVAAGGCAAEMRSASAWAAHPQGRSVSAEPLLWRTSHPCGTDAQSVDAARPLAGIKLLDLTRVLAGPVATRLLAGFGAEVLRVDPPFWTEPPLEPETTLGKRCARLDLRDAAAAKHVRALLAEADVVVHGYRPGALDGLGLGDAERRQIRPSLVDVCLDAYGWTGPWAGRRGFDSLVQMSAGITEAGMRHFGADVPTPLPVQALDHATGYILATAALRGLADRQRSGAGCTVRASLARTAALLTSLPRSAPEKTLTKPEPDDFDDEIEATAWGNARRLRPPLQVDGAPIWWNRPASPLGSADARWCSAGA